MFALVVTAFFSACAKEETLEAPTNLAVDVDNNLTWSEVSGARTYTVEVSNVDTAETEEKNTRKAVLDLAFLQTGDYVLRVRANSGSQDSIQSAWSEGVEFHMNYTTGCVYKLINNNSEYQIAQAGTSTTGTVTFEDMYRGKPVTMIAEGAFRGSSRVTGIVLGANIRTVGKEAFYNCANLQSAKLNDSLTELGNGVFQNCNALSEVNIPDGITSIGESTFAYCYSLENIVIGRNVTTIGKSAFSNCTALKEIVLPDSVETLGEYSFYSASAAERLTTGKNLTTIGVSAFSNCSALSEVEFFGADFTERDAEIGNLTVIGSYAFARCTALKKIEIPETVQTLGSLVFNQDVNLETISIPDSVTSVGTMIVNGTALAAKSLQNTPGYIYADGWLTQITDAKKEELSDENNKVNINTDTTSTVKKKETLSENTRGIAANVFYECNGLSIVMLPEKVKTVGAYAFANCKSLETVRSKQGSALRMLETAAFYNSAKLTTVSFLTDAAGRNGLETIGAYVFYGTAYRGANIPQTVNCIGKDAFKESALWQEAQSSGAAVVSTVKGMNEVVWVVGYIEGKSVGSVSMAGKKGIADYAFSECDTITAVTDTADVEYIGRSAFYSSSLKSISLGRKITEIQPYTFYGCDLGAITLPANLTSIGRSAFYQTSLSRVDFSQSNKLERVGEYAFFGAESLERVNFGDSLKEIGDYAFYGCKVLDLSLEGSELPDSLEKIGNAAFKKCSVLKTVKFGSGLKEIGTEAFRESGIRTLNLPDGLEKIGAFAFYYNEELESITFGEGLKEIGNYAFCGDVKLTGVALPESLEKLGDYAFRDCENLSAVAVSSSVKELGLHAFYWCDALTVYTDAKAEENSWIRFWNSSYRPVVYACTLSGDKSYVVSMSTGTTENISAVGGLSDPYRFGYTFEGWATGANATTGEYTTAETLTLPAGTTLYAVWSPKTSA